MVTIYPVNQRYKITMGELEVEVAPLKHSQKSSINSRTVSMNGGEIYQDHALSIFLVLKNSIKAIKGFQNPDGTEYELQFDEDVLTDECVEDLISIDELGGTLQFYAKQAIHNIPKDIVNPVTQKPIEHVKFEMIKSNIKKKSSENLKEISG